MSPQFSSDSPRYSRWKVAPRAPREYFHKAASLPPLIAQLLYNRGLENPDQFESFLCADERLCHDPFLLPDIDKAVHRIHQAILGGETIAVYGDFDADGITSTALLSQGLAKLGGNVYPYIPHRFQEGYGLNTTALRSLFQLGITLVVTVDCGIASVAEVEHARQWGMDIVITDHHAVTSRLPPAVAAVNPKRPDSSYPFRDLAGVGIAFKLLQALSREMGKEEELEEHLFLDLVALGTVADVTPLIGENRYLVKRGLDVLNKSERLGIQEMLSIAGLGRGGVDTESISYILGPRINAPGRLENAITSYRLLVTSSPDEARRLAAQLEEINLERQRLTDEALVRAKEELSSLGNVPIIMVGSEECHPGVAGVVAGKLTDEYYRPAIVLALSGEVSRGSARSIPEFNIIEALRQCGDLFIRFGGHAQAAGFTLPTSNVERLRERLLRIAAAQLTGLDFQPPLTIDAPVRLTTLNGEIFKCVERLAPFGYGNPSPVFVTRNVRVVDCHAIGNSGQHLKLKLREGDVVWDAIAFQFGHLASSVDHPFDVVYNLEAHEWGGTRTLRLNIIDMARSASLLGSVFKTLSGR